MASHIEWFDDNNRLAIVTSKFIMGVNLYTHETLFTIEIKTKPWNKIIILNNNFLIFEDAYSSINVYDIRH